MFRRRSVTTHRVEVIERHVERVIGGVVVIRGGRGGGIGANSAMEDMVVMVVVGALKVQTTNIQQTGTRKNVKNKTLAKLALAPEDVLLYKFHNEEYQQNVETKGILTDLGIYKIKLN